MIGPLSDSYTTLLLKMFRMASKKKNAWSHFSYAALRRQRRDVASRCSQTSAPKIRRDKVVCTVIVPEVCRTWTS